MLAGRRIVLGVSGGVAAYKAAYLARRLVERGADVRAVMTASSREFLGPQTLAAVTGTPPVTDFFGSDDESPHTNLARWADAVVVAPATASTIARLASGLSEDVLTRDGARPPPCPLSSLRRCTPRCGTTPRPSATSTPCWRMDTRWWAPTAGRWPAATSGRAAYLSPSRLSTLSRRRSPGISRAGPCSCPRAGPGRQSIPCASSGIARPGRWGPPSRQKRPGAGLVSRSSRLLPDPPLPM